MASSRDGRCSLYGLCRWYHLPALPSPGERRAWDRLSPRTRALERSLELSSEWTWVRAVKTARQRRTSL